MFASLRESSIVALTALLLAPGVHAALPVPERVTLPSLDIDAAGKPVEISALFFRPPRATPGAAAPRGAATS